MLPLSSAKIERSIFREVLFDALLLTLLVAAVALAFLLEPQAKSKPVSLSAPEPAPIPQPERQAPRLRIAVTPEANAFDEMGPLLDKLGDGYAYRLMPLDDLLDAERVAQFDVIFLTCSGYTDIWLGAEQGASDRGGMNYGPNEATFARAKEVLRGFVSNGGTLYASDLHYNLIARCFPEYVDEALLDRGVPQAVAADVIDAGLKESIGDTIELAFDQPDWRPAAFSADNVTTFLRGDIVTVDGSRVTVPLLVRFSLGEGNVIFTSFHNEKQQSEKELELLKFLIFSAVTAGVDADASRTMARGGFSQTKKNLFSASTDSEAVSAIYANESISDLQFILAFADQGAILELLVEGPGGIQESRQGTSTIMVEIPGAAVGDWKYTIRAVKVPSENFPFTITVGKK